MSSWGTAANVKDTSKDANLCLAAGRDDATCRKENPALVMGTDRGDMELACQWMLTAVSLRIWRRQRGRFHDGGTDGAVQTNCAKEHVGDHSLQNAGSCAGWAAA